MSEAATSAPPAAAAGPVGKPRGIAFVIIISIITFGIYFLYWLYKTGEETKRYSGDGLGGVLWLVIGLLIGIVMWFVAPSEVGKLYSREGQHQPVSGVTGFWMLLPLIGFIIWVVKVQGALNRFWESKGAAA
jgi:hypothetical protein